MTKQDIFDKFTAEMNLRQISLKSHVFRVYSRFKPNEQNNVSIRHRVIQAKRKEQLLIVNFAFDAICSRKEIKVWSGNYVYQIVMDFENEDIIENAITDENTETSILNRVMIHNLWPYLREELHSDTAKAGIPVFTLPHRN